MATRKVICVRKKPRKEAAAILGRSFMSTFSLGRKSEMAQKRIPAPSDLMEKRVSGEKVPLPVKSLHTITFNPKIE